MSYLLDTCTISESVSARPHPGVVSFLETLDEEDAFLSVITLAELRRGVERLPASARRQKLRSWLDVQLPARFSGRLLPITVAVAERWGRVCAAAEARGRKLPVLDGFLAATALVHGLTVVTRNAEDFAASGVPIFNPWQPD